MDRKKFEHEFLKAVKEQERLFPARHMKSDGRGGIILDPNNPRDREWYENDEAYNGLVD